MSLWMGISLVVVFIGIVLTSAVRIVLEDMRYENELTGKTILLGKGITTICLLVSISVWPAFVLEGLVTAPISVVLSVQAGVLVACYLSLNEW